MESLQNRLIPVLNSSRISTKGWFQFTPAKPDLQRICYKYFMKDYNYFFLYFQQVLRNFYSGGDSCNILQSMSSRVEDFAKFIEDGNNFSKMSNVIHLNQEYYQHPILVIITKRRRPQQRDVSLRMLEISFATCKRRSSAETLKIIIN